MNRIALLPIFIILITLGIGCSPSQKFHKSALPDPESFNAHFGDMDTDSNALVNWEEFKAFFPNADPQVFKALDPNGDGGVDHDEWHAFKKAHGLKHKE